MSSPGPSSLMALRQRMAARRGVASTPTATLNTTTSSTPQSSTRPYAPTPTHPHTGGTPLATPTLDHRTPISMPTSLSTPQWASELAALEAVLPPSPTRAAHLSTLRQSPHSTHAWGAYLDSLPPPEPSTHAQALRVFNRVTRILPTTAANRHDPRFLRLWLDLAALQASTGDDDGLIDARATFKLMRVQRIGLDNPDLYLAWAGVEERAANFPKAAKLRADAAGCRPLLAGGTGGGDENRAPGTPATESAKRPAMGSGGGTVRAAKTPRMPFGDGRPPRRAGDVAPVTPAVAAHAPTHVAASGSGLGGGRRKPLGEAQISVPEGTYRRQAATPPWQDKVPSAPALRTKKEALEDYQRQKEMQRVAQFQQVQPQQAAVPPITIPEETPERPEHVQKPTQSLLSTIPERSPLGQAEHHKQRQNYHYYQQPPAAVTPRSPASASTMEGSIGADGLSDGKAPEGWVDENSRGKIRERVDDRARARDIAGYANDVQSARSVQSSGTEKRDAGVSGRRGDYGTDSGRSARVKQQNDHGSAVRERGMAQSPAQPPKPEFPELKHVVVVKGKPYCILGAIGKGGSSKVYKVLSPDFRVLALKRVKVPFSQSKALHSYANEIQLLEKLRGCSTIIRLEDSEVNPGTGTINLIMEHGDLDFAQFLLKQPKDKPLDPDLRRTYWKQMLEAVDTVHHHKVVHGDLKPANFMHVSGTLKLIDFGIAKAIQTDDTTKIFREAQIGTPNYMSPEALVAEDDDEDDDKGEDGDDSAEMQDDDRNQRRARPKRYRIGRASDIWSLGCILYQMVYGKTPFAHIKNTMQKLHCIQDSSYGIAFPSNSATNPDLLHVLRGCLERDPAERMTMPTLKALAYSVEISDSGQKSKVACLNVLKDVFDEMGVGERPDDETLMSCLSKHMGSDVKMGRSSEMDDRTGERTGERGVGGHSLSRMTPTSTAITGNGAHYGMASSTRPFRE